MKDLTDANIYYINLDKRYDRKEQFESQIALSAMPPIERVSALHGASLDTRFDKKIGVHTRVQVITEHRRSHYEIHSRGALGASLSHIKAWKTFVDSKADYALIIEDDAQLPATFAMMFRDSAKYLPDSWDIWILGWNHNPSDIKPSDAKTPFRQILHFVGAHCYLIKRKAAQILLDEAFPIENHVEHYMSNVAYLHNLKIVRNIQLYVPQMDRQLNVSDVRKPKGCPTCIVDDKPHAIKARLLNMNTP
jgi:GR25 family glycosyltransferase involved in LPS biosynthesis